MELVWMMTMTTRTEKQQHQRNHALSAGPIAGKGAKCRARDQIAGSIEFAPRRARVTQTAPSQQGEKGRERDTTYKGSHLRRHTTTRQNDTQPDAARVGIGTRNARR
jgi:hypothetical protein